MCFLSIPAIFPPLVAIADKWNTFGRFGLHVDKVNAFFRLRDNPKAVMKSCFVSTFPTIHKFSMYTEFHNSTWISFRSFMLLDTKMSLVLQARKSLLTLVGWRRRHRMTLWSFVALQQNLFVWQKLVVHGAALKSLIAFYHLWLSFFPHPFLLWELFHAAKQWKWHVTYTCYFLWLPPLFFFSVQHGVSKKSLHVIETFGSRKFNTFLTTDGIPGKHLT